MPAGNLDLHVDPKTAWALANRNDFPVDVNTADRHQLLRVPGLGRAGGQSNIDRRVGIVVCDSQIYARSEPASSEHGISS